MSDKNINAAGAFLRALKDHKPDPKPEEKSSDELKVLIKLKSADPIVIASWKFLNGEDPKKAILDTLEIIKGELNRGLYDEALKFHA